MLGAGSGFRLGRILGITIRIDWSWLLIFALVVWNLSAAFLQLQPRWDAVTRWGLSILAAILFFSSVLAHELAHSLVARANNLPVRNITLFLFGGVANIGKEPPSAKAEFLIAIVGPLTSFLLGAGLLAMGGISLIPIIRQFGGSPVNIITRLSPASIILLWLGSVNIILAIFNLIPGFPLDGGRVLRSILWGITRNLRKATRLASWVGQIIAWMMIIIGAAMILGINVGFLGTGVVSGLWLIFIGWFLNSASTQSYQQVAIRQVLADISVHQMMRANPPTVEPDCSVNELIYTHVMGTDDQAFPVLDQNHLVGIVTLDDVRHVSRDAWITTTVREIMTPRERLVTVAPEDDAAKAMDKLVARDVRQLPVVRNNSEFVGLLRRRDIMNWLRVHSEFAG